MSGFTRLQSWLRSFLRGVESKEKDQTMEEIERQLAQIERKLDTLPKTQATRTRAIDKLLSSVETMLPFTEKSLSKLIVELGRTLNIMRDELMLVLHRPAMRDGASSATGESQLFREWIEASNIRELYPTDLYPGLEQLSMPVSSIHEESGHENQVDLLYVAAIAKLIGAKNIFEFGTYQGRTTYHMAGATSETKVHTLNLPPEADPSVASFLGAMFKGSDREDRITQIYSDSRTFDTKPYLGKMDYIFVDGDHSYDLIKNDTEKALEMLKPGGTIVWHDFAVKSPGVVRYLSEFAAARSVFRLKHTCLIIYQDGVDAMAVEQPPRRKSWVS